MFNGKLYITIDTEMDSSSHWVKQFPPHYTSVIDGIPKLLRPIWDKYDICPIYFVSPEVLYEEKCCEILKQEITKGAIIGAHLHPEYIEPDSIWGEGIEKVTPQFPCLAYETSVEKEKLRNLTNLIEDKLGVHPIWYRAARFGADDDTMKILHELGYQYDSSVTPHIDWRVKGGPNHSMEPEEKYQRNGITEVPITIRGKRFGILGRLLPENWLFYTWLRPTHMFLAEEKALVRRCANQEQDLIMMFHSMEIMINKTPYVRNQFMQHYYLWRLNQTIQYAKKKGYTTYAN